MSFLKSLFIRTKNPNAGKTTEEEFFKDSNFPKTISKRVDLNKKALQELFEGTFDFNVEKVSIAGKVAYICYLGTLLEKNELSRKVLESVRDPIQKTPFHSMAELRDIYFPTTSFQIVDKSHKVVWHILNGFAAIMVEGCDEALLIDVGLPPQRAVTEPSTQTIIRGPKDGFVEALPVNIALVRKRIKNPRLKFEIMQIGRDTQTSVAIGYIHDITNQDLLSEVRQRVKKIDVAAIIDSGNIEEFIVDKTITPFPLIFNTERPDSITGHLLEGKIAIFVDGSPFVLSVPTVLTDFFQATEDYYQPFLMASFIRAIRFIAFMVALLLPSLYVAISTFHHELMPTQLLISIQAQRDGVPFPAVIEILVMELTFEVLREAGVRMPRAVGQTVSIVGALVIGQAAVEAGLVSNVLVIVVAFTAIASFVSPIYNFSNSTRLLRFVVIMSASLLGLYGILLFLVAMVIHLVSLRSFGVPYLAPVAPFIPEDHGDVFVRMPNFLNRGRPTYLQTKTPAKSDSNHQPSPPKQTGGKGE